MSKKYWTNTILWIYSELYKIILLLKARDEGVHFFGWFALEKNVFYIVNIFLQDVVYTIQAQYLDLYEVNKKSINIILNNSLAWLSLLGLA